MKKLSVKEQVKLAKKLADQKAQAAAKAKAKATPKSGEKRSYIARGTAGTFAGHRPPKCPAKRASFNALQAAYLEVKANAIKKKRTFTETQKGYVKAMRSIMKELACTGLKGPELMKQAAEKWSSQVKVA